MSTYELKKEEVEAWELTYTLEIDDRIGDPGDYLVRRSNGYIEIIYKDNFLKDYKLKNVSKKLDRFQPNLQLPTGNILDDNRVSLILDR